MKVVFVQDVPDVAMAGDVKEVKRGHARNYLFPKGFAVPATPDELSRVEARRRAAAKRRDEVLSEARGAAGVLDGVALTFAKKVTSKGNIYGSVSAIAIQQELKRLGHEVEKSMIKLDDPLRQLGEHEVDIELARDVVAKVKVTIEAAEEGRETKEAKPVEAEATGPAEAEATEASETEEEAVEETESQNESPDETA